VEECTKMLNYSAHPFLSLHHTTLESPRQKFKGRRERLQSVVRQPLQNPQPDRFQTIDGEINQSVDGNIN